VTRFIPPAGPGIRVDSGIRSGDEITQFYDPMLAKLIVYGEDRPAAIARMRSALEQTAVFGVTTNAPLLHAISTHPAFQQGHTHTGFLVEHGLAGEDDNIHGPPLQDAALVAAALYDIVRDATPGAVSNHHSAQAAAASVNPWHALGPWRMIGESRRIAYHYQGEEHHVAAHPLQNGTVANSWSIQVDDRPPEDVAYTSGSDDLVLLHRGAKQLQAYVQHVNGETQVYLRGQLYRLERRQPPNVDIAARGSSVATAQKALTSPMAGTIVKVQAHDGDMVQQRQVLVVLSAMKMEHTIAAPYAGKVRHVYYQEGDVVKGGAVVVEME